MVSVTVIFRYADSKEKLHHIINYFHDTACLQAAETANSKLSMKRQIREENPEHVVKLFSI